MAKLILRKLDVSRNISLWKNDEVTESSEKF